MKSHVICHEWQHSTWWFKPEVSLGALKGQLQWWESVGTNSGLQSKRREGKRRECQGGWRELGPWVTRSFSSPITNRNKTTPESTFYVPRPSLHLPISFPNLTFLPPPLFSSPLLPLVDTWVGVMQVGDIQKARVTVPSISSPSHHR